MRISDLRLDRTASFARATARVTWETCGRAPFELYFETDGAGRDDLAAEPDAFLVACFLPAINHGERRLQVEATGGFRARRPREPERAGFFFTGGIDSTHLLFENRRTYPPEHPASFADCLSIHGNLRAESADSPWNARALAVLARTAAARRLTLLPIRTNLWDLDPDLSLVRNESLSTPFAAAAHCLRSRLTRVSLATGLDVAAEIPRGTHPLLDPLYSSSAVEIRHDPIRLSRFERLRVLATEGGDAVDNLIVCLAYPGAPHVNCGECEKCVRTMTQLLALGRLADVRTFRHRDLSPEVIRGIRIAPVEAPYWAGVLPALAQRGRGDLVEAVEEKLAEMRRLQRWSEDAGLKGGLRRLDRRLLGGRLLELRKRLT